MSTHPAPATPAFGTLAPRLTELSLRDAQRLGRRLEGARKIRKPEARAAVLTEIEAEIAKAEERMGARRGRLPAVSYPEQLPVSQKKSEIADAIRDHQVVIVAGETGSGKTTQIPKISWLGSSVGTSDRLKSDRSPVRPRPQPQQRPRSPYRGLVVVPLGSSPMIDDGTSVRVRCQGFPPRLAARPADGFDGNGASSPTR